LNADRGIIYVVLEHFGRHLYPRALDIEKQLAAGERLSDSQLAHVADVLDGIRQLRPLIERHSEHNDLVAGVVSTYAGIAKRALQNEGAPAAVRETP
jgi:hypothetical protein